MITLLELNKPTEIARVVYTEKHIPKFEESLNDSKKHGFPGIPVISKNQPTAKLFLQSRTEDIVGYITDIKHDTDKNLLLGEFKKNPDADLGTPHTIFSIRPQTTIRKTCIEEPIEDSVDVLLWVNNLFVIEG